MLKSRNGANAVETCRSENRPPQGGLKCSTRPSGGKRPGSRSPFNAVRREGFPLLGASVGGDLETRANFDNRGRGPSHGILRWIVQKRCRISASGPLPGGAPPFPRQVEADQHGPF